MGTLVSGAPYYGYEKDAVEPPDGGYSFVEWEELGPVVRLSVLGLHGINPEDYTFPTHAAMRDAVARFESREQAAETLASWREVAIEERAKLDAVLATNESERVVAEGMDRYLKADPGEIKAIIAAIGQGRTGREVECDEPIPVYTCVWLDSGRIRGVRPGSMSNAVTATQPSLLRQETNEWGKVVRTYKTRVFVK